MKILEIKQYVISNPFQSKVKKDKIKWVKWRIMLYELLLESHRYLHAIDIFISVKKRTIKEKKGNLNNHWHFNRYFYF